MPLLGFNVFYQKILNGSKRQTIRPLRKKPIEVGDKLYLYWHLRRKDCEKLKEVYCNEEFLLQFDDGFMIIGTDTSKINIALTNRQKNNLARKDGFKNMDEMLDWFYGKYDDVEERIFQVIRW